MIFSRFCKGYWIDENLYSSMFPYDFILTMKNEFCLKRIGEFFYCLSEVANIFTHLTINSKWKSVLQSLILYYLCSNLDSIVSLLHILAIHYLILCEITPFKISSLKYKVNALLFAVLCSFLWQKFIFFFQTFIFFSTKRVSEEHSVWQEAWGNRNHILVKCVSPWIVWLIFFKQNCGCKTALYLYSFNIQHGINISIILLIRGAVTAMGEPKSYYKSFIICGIRMHYRISSWFLKIWLSLPFNG